MNNNAKDLLKKTITKIDGAYAPATIRAYKANFERFIDFCENQKSCALPANVDTVTEYVKQISNGRLKSASIRIALASISSIHKLNQLNDPTNHPDVKLEMRRMHRMLGRESMQALGINKNVLKFMLNHIDNTIIGVRDKALLLTAYDGMCRRSELVSLNIEDISYSGNTMKIKLRRSKTDQYGLGRWLHLNEEAKIAIEAWLEQAHLSNGSLFRGIKRNKELSDSITASQINRIYKKVAKNSAISSEHIRQISAHSMRVGAAQDLLLSGASLPMIMNKGRWTKAETVMRYIEKISYAQE